MSNWREEMAIQQSIEISEGKSTPITLDQRRPSGPKAILEDLYELLEEYGPSWYTKEHHDRALAALLDRAS